MEIPTVDVSDRLEWSVDDHHTVNRSDTKDVLQGVRTYPPQKPVIHSYVPSQLHQIKRVNR